MTARDDDPDAGRPQAAGALYALPELVRLTGATARQLRSWHKSGLLPARSDNGGLFYGFQDVAAARTAIDLINKGVTTRQVREAVEAVRAWRPDVAHPLSALRVVSDHGTLVVRLDETLLEPRSGQAVLDLPMGPLYEAAGEVVRMRPKPPAPDPADEPQDADGWLRAGLDAERGDDPETAEMAYRRALSIEPTHPGALLNLGNLVYARGKLRPACELYRAATRAAPDYPQAWYNLANVLDDLGHPDAAARAYETAIELDPAYADAHFNLALLWEKQGQRRQARVHWEAYLGLDPEHPSASIARRFLESDEA